MAVRTEATSQKYPLKPKTSAQMVYMAESNTATRTLGQLDAPSQTRGVLNLTDGTERGHSVDGEIGAWWAAE